MNADHAPYFGITKLSRLDKSINSLLGIIEGISIDSNINQSERNFLDLWLSEHNGIAHLHPFNELVPIVSEALKDGVLTSDERDDIVWLCERLTSSEYHDATTADMQRLHAIFAGIAADGIVTEDELRGLSDWLADHEHLRRCWPYDEVDSLITAVLADKTIDEREHEMLFRFFLDFVSIADDKTITSPVFKDGNSIVAVCASCPEIVFKNSKFCFTGASGNHKRSELAQIVSALGGVAVKYVTGDLDYLVIGSEGNPCWTYACYGRKVEKAVGLRKIGSPLMIIHEHDFHDAVADIVG